MPNNLVCGKDNILQNRNQETTIICIEFRVGEIIYDLL